MSQEEIASAQQRLEETQTIREKEVNEANQAEQEANNAINVVQEAVQKSIDATLNEQIAKNSISGAINEVTEAEQRLIGAGSITPAEAREQAIADAKQAIADAKQGVIDAEKAADEATKAANEAGQALEDAEKAADEAANKFIEESLDAFEAISAEEQAQEALNDALENCPPDDDDPGSGKGDPHLTTFDGLEYDFHALGEYTFVESVDEDLEIQILTEGRDGSNNSFITGIATNVGEDIIEFNPKWDTVSINGVSNNITEETPLILEEGIISVDNTRNQPTYTINYLNGEALVIDDVKTLRGEDIFNVEVFSADTEIVGLLGNNNSDTSDDLALRDGTLLSQPATREQIDNELASSWAVSPEESLFSYIDDIAQNADLLTF